MAALKVVDVTSVAQLQELLVAAGADVGSWQPGKLQGLFHEIVVKRECQLVEEGGKLFRRTTVVKMGVLSPEGRALVEIGERVGETEKMAKEPQEPAGKIAPDESPAQAVVREMEEELHVHPAYYQMLDDPARYNWEERRESRSYPGLPTIYDLYRFVVRLDAMAMEGLAAFWAESSGRYEIPDKGDEESKTLLYFAWRDAS